jgi:hypothetical protein
MNYYGSSNISGDLIFKIVLNSFYQIQNKNFLAALWGQAKKLGSK